MKQPLNSTSGRRNWWRLHVDHQRKRRGSSVATPAEPLPPGAPVEDGSFEEPITRETISGAIKLAGKKATGSSGKFIFDIGAIQANRVYTIQYDPNFTALAQGGKLAAVGFGLKSGNTFHLATLKGDGGTGLTAHQISGSAFSQTTGHTLTDQGAAAHGTQAGPNWLQLQTSADGSTYTLRTSPDGVTWADEITAAAPAPLNSAIVATTFGVAGYFDGADAGSFSIDVALWRSVAVPAVDNGDILLSSSDELDTPSRLLLSGDAQTGTDALAL